MQHPDLYQAHIDLDNRHDGEKYPLVDNLTELAHIVTNARQSQHNRQNVEHQQGHRLVLVLFVQKSIAIVHQE